MRSLLVTLAFLASAHATEFLAPAPVYPYKRVTYGQDLELAIKVTKTVLNAKIAFGLSVTDRMTLKSNIQAYAEADTLRVKVTLPAFISETAREYEGPAGVWLLDGIGGTVTQTRVEVGKMPPVSGTGKASPTIAQGNLRPSPLVDILGRNNAVTPAFFWRYPHAP